MDLARFTQLMEVRGCTHQGKRFCGVYRNWPFSVRFLRGGARGAAFSLRVEFERVPAALFTRLGGAVQRRAKLRRLNGDSVSALFASVAVPEDADVEPVWDALMETLADSAQRDGLSLPRYCPVCGRPGCNALAYDSSGGYQPVHAACVLRASAAQQIRVQQNEVNGSYGLGGLGAVLGGLVGAVPVILFEVFYTGLVYIWMYAIYALIPLAAHRGYLLFRGKRTWAAAAIVIVVSVLLVPVIHYLTVGFQVMKEAGVFISVENYMMLFRLAGTDGLLELGQYLLFTGFGILVVLGIILRSNKDTWNEAAFAAATLRPMEAGGAEAPAFSPLPPPAPAQVSGIAMQDAPPSATPGELT